MAFERQWASIAPRLFTSNGTSLGKVIITDTADFRVNMEVTIGHPTLPYLALKVKRVNSTTEMILCQIDKSASTKDTVDLSAYDNTSFVFAKDQTKKHPSVKEIEEATYEQEPVLAKRSVLVDKYGRIVDSANPLPISGTIMVSAGQQFDDIKLTYNSNDDLILVQKYYLGALMVTKQLTYDSNDNLIEVKDI